MTTEHTGICFSILVSSGMLSYLTHRTSEVANCDESVVLDEAFR